MKEVINISFGSSSHNFDQIIQFNNEEIHLRRFGADYNKELLYHLIETFGPESDAMAISDFPSEVKINKKKYTHQIVKELRARAKDTPVFDGNQFRKIAYPWSLKKILSQNEHLFKEKKIGFYSSLIQWNYLNFFEELECKFYFADAYFNLGLPHIFKSKSDLEKFFAPYLTALSKVDFGKRKVKDFSSRLLNKTLLKSFNDCDVFVLHESQLRYIKLNNLTNKTVIIDHMSTSQAEKIFNAGAKEIITLFSSENQIMGSSTIEACLGATLGLSKLSEEDILNFIMNSSLKPSILLPQNKAKEKNKFAFVIHPLSKDQFSNLAIFKYFASKTAVNIFEKMAVKVPGYLYCQMTGIKSEHDGAEVVGDLYVILGTPKMLLSTPVEKIYHSLINICKLAHSNGANVIGLGAYTKIVGDAGVTVNKSSPIPLTTGNSLSAASTLWAANLGLDKMNLVQKQDSVYQGTCMVIGATGSIGKICSKVLTKQWKKVIVVAPRPYKVLELVDELKKFSPQTEIIGTTNANKYSQECDLIITTTSAQGEKIIDIDLVKPGCVICDVSRPFDIKLEEAARRPDVLIIASGEVELPGEVKIPRSIGLEGSIVYACLAETAILAMEGLHESFSLSRELSYEKIVQIDRLARKHGVRLSSLMGHTGEIHDNEIELCRNHALKKLAKMKV